MMNNNHILKQYYMDKCYKNDLKYFLLQTSKKSHNVPKSLNEIDI